MALVDPNLRLVEEDQELLKKKNRDYEGLKSFFAGIGSGIFKIPEEAISLGATLYDLGAGTDTAAEVESFFEDLNPFDDLAEETTAGKIAETLVSLGVPSTAGFKIGTKLAKKALDAKKIGKYVDIGKFKKAGFKERKNLVGEIRKKQAEAGKIKTKKEALLDKGYVFGGGLGGSAVADYVFADNELGTIGDAIGLGPTQRNEQEAEGREEATRELLNRLKFAGEGALLTTTIGGAFNVLKRGADSVKYKFTDDPVEDWIKKNVAKFTSLGIQPRVIKEITRASAQERGKFKVQSQAFGRELQKNFEDILDETADVAQKTKNKEKLSLAITDALQSGDRKALKSVLDDLNVNSVKQDSLIEAVDGSQTFIKNLSEQILELVPPEATALRKTITANLNKYLTTTYKLLEKNNPYNAAFAKWEPTAEIQQQALNFIKEELLKGAPGTSALDITVQARDILDNLLRGNISQLQTPLKVNLLKKMGLDINAGILKPKTKIPPEIKALLGPIEDPALNVAYTIAKQGSLITELSMLGRLAKSGKDKIFFFDDAVPVTRDGKIVLDKVSGKEKALKTLGGKPEDIVNLGEIGGLSKLGFKTELNNAYTTREIAESFQDQIKAGEGITNSNIYKWMVLAPKSFSQQAKTLFSPFTHMRNIVSAAAFTMMNGNISFNPMKNARTFAKAFGAFSRGRRGKEAMDLYLDYQRRGIVGTNPLIGEMEELAKDVFTFGSKGDPTSAIGALTEKIAKVRKWTVDLYTAEDDFWKIYNYNFEIDNYKNVIKNITRNLGLTDEGQLGKAINNVKQISSIAETVLVGGVRQPNKLYKETAERLLKETGLSVEESLKIFNQANRKIGKVLGRTIDINDPIYFQGRNTLGKNVEGLDLPEEELKAAIKRGYVDEDPVEALIKNLAGDITRNNIPNYEYVGEAIKSLRKAPIGTFVAFPAEILRTGFNTLQRAARELSQAETRALGMKRMAGVLGTGAALPVGAIEIGKIASGFDSDDMEALRRFVPEWSKNGLLVPTGKDPVTGNQQYLDLSYIYPYDALLRPANTIMNELVKGNATDEQINKTLLDSGVMAMKELVKPFLSEAIYTEAVVDLIARGGRTRDGRQVFRQEDPPGEKLYKGTMHVLETQLPGSISQAKRVYNAKFGKADKYGQVYDMWDEAPGIFGFRNIEIKPEQSFKFMVGNFNKGISSARATFLGDVLKGGAVSPEEVLEQYLGAEQQRFNIFRNFRKDVEAAKRLGIKETDLMKQLERLPKNTRQAILNNKYQPYIPSDEVKTIFYENALNLSRLTGAPLIDPLQKVLPAIFDYVETNADKNLDDSPDYDVSIPQQSSLFDFPDLSSFTTPRQPVTPDTGSGSVVTGQGPTVQGQPAIGTRTPAGEAIAAEFIAEDPSLASIDIARKNRTGIV
jgi:hypothetical protein